MKTILILSLLCSTAFSHAGSVHFTYDLAGRLTGADYGGGRTIAYTYDANGNLLQRLVQLGVLTGADLALLKSAAPLQLELGRGNLVYTLSLTNAGPEAASNVVVSDPLPATVLFASASAGAVRDGVLTAHLGHLPGGASLTIRLQVVPLAAGPVTNRASVSADTADPNPQNNLASLTNLVVVALDANTNGLPDWWEELYFPNPADRIATNDFDLDGLLNRDEYVAGTNPTDPASRLVIGHAASTPGGFTLTFLAASGRVYSVHYSSNLAARAWSDLATHLPGTGGPVSVTDTNAPAASARFYRLGLEVPRR
jgi:uncharacterized repeat protein (TIGR01451 family)